MIVLELSGRRAVTTSPGRRCENWEFMEEFFLTVNNVDNDKLLLTLVDYEASVSNIKKTLQCVNNFLSAADEAQTVRHYDRNSHFKVGERTLSLTKAFTGHKQK